MGNFTFENILISFIVTWGIGLLPPTLIRYVFLKRPVGNWAAIGICGLFYFFSFLVYSAISGSTRGHGALILVAMVSYWILRKDSPIKRGVETEVPPSRQGAASQPPVIGSVAVARSSTLAYPSESRTTPHPPDMSAQTTPPSATTYQASALDEDAIYEIVANEMDSGRMDKGLWTRLFAELDGDEKKVKIAYIKQRAEKLMVAERVRTEQRAREEAEQLRQAEEVQLRQMTIKERIQKNLIGPEEAAKLAEGFSTQFLLMCQRGTEGQVEEILKQRPVLVAVTNSEGYTGLHIAVQEGREQMVKLLIEQGSNPGVQNQYGLTPYGLAMRKCAENISEYPTYRRIADYLTSFLPICPYCGSKTDSAAAVCGTCKRVFPAPRVAVSAVPSLCPKCNAETSVDAKACIKCGTPIFLA